MLAGDATVVRPELVSGQGFTEVLLRRPLWWRKVPELLAFLIVWLAGGVLAAVLLLATGGDRPWFFGTWMLVWGGVGALFLFGMAWRTFGRETLIARADRLAVIRHLLFLRHRVEVPAGKIQSVEWVADDPSWRVTRNGRHVPQSVIRIVTTDRAISCARGISESEAHTAIGALKQRLAVSWRRRE